MRSHFTRAAIACSALAWLAIAIPSGQTVADDLTDHPAIQYRTRPTNDPIAQLQARIDSGSVRLSPEGQSGILRSLLQALDVPVSSQIMVFSQGSVQSRLIEANNPRALFFNDDVVVGWVRKGFIEVAAQDAEQGTVFYTVNPSPRGHVVLERHDECLSCHNTSRTGDVAGVIEPMTQSRPLERRWGGWYVTGNAGSIRHLGNVALDAVLAAPDTINATPLASLARVFDTSGYLTPYSDIAALMVFEHQMQMMNRLTRLGWEARVLAREGRLDAKGSVLQDRVRDVVDYMLLVDEAPMASPLTGTSGFAEAFSASGPRDTKGRSLRQLDLTTRLLKYPCSYMIYSRQFDRLPPIAKNTVYERMWAILSGREKAEPYRRLSPSDRRAIIEILRETKTDLPRSFKGEL